MNGHGFRWFSLHSVAFGFRLAAPFLSGTMLSGGGPPCHTTVV
jgi:hypothetical protein